MAILIGVLAFVFVLFITVATGCWWIIPIVIFLAVCYGAWHYAGPLTPRVMRGWWRRNRARLARAVVLALIAFLLLATLWCIWERLPECEGGCWDKTPGVSSIFGSTPPAPAHHAKAPAAATVATTTNPVFSGDSLGHQVIPDQIRTMVVKQGQSYRLLTPEGYKWELVDPPTSGWATMRSTEKDQYKNLVNVFETVGPVREIDLRYVQRLCKTAQECA